MEKDMKAYFKECFPGWVKYIRKLEDVNEHEIRAHMEFEDGPRTYVFGQKEPGELYLRTEDDKDLEANMKAVSSQKMHTV